MKRQRGRGRKPGGGGGGGGNNHNHGNRSLESNGPDVKIRGTAAQIYEKYSQFARDAQSGGDRVKYENYLQHAEHYYRVMAATMPRERLLQQQNGEGGFIHAQPSSEGGAPTGEGGVVPQGEQHEPVKSMDDGANDDGDDDGDDDEGDGGVVSTSAGGGEGAEAGARDEERGEGEQGERQGRNRRGRRRRRPQDGHPGERHGERSGGGDPEARSALDSLARKQGALAGD